MARPLRIEYPGAVYHVTFRGNARKAVCRDEADRKMPGTAVSHQLRRWREAASGSGNKTRFLFDARNRLIQKTHPGGDSASISYDARGLPVTHTGGRGVETALKYNGDGLLTNVSYSATNTPSMRYTFNNRRQLIGMADGWSTNSYRYDAQGRLTNIVEVFGASSQTWGGQT